MERRDGWYVVNDGDYVYVTRKDGLWDVASGTERIEWTDEQLDLYGTWADPQPDPPPWQIPDPGEIEFPHKPNQNIEQDPNTVGIQPGVGP